MRMNRRRYCALLVVLLGTAWVPAARAVNPDISAIGDTRASWAEDTEKAFQKAVAYQQKVERQLEKAKETVAAKAREN